MCGIAGIFSNSDDVYQFRLTPMCEQLVSRGPDSFGVFISDKIGLGHRRLSIIDLETGSQPMQDAEGKSVIVFNGEIYNFKSLRIELLALGAKFQTNSDTEVILQAYLFWGIETTLKRLEGMFAFALYDKGIKKLYLARDKFGEKPLYYTNNSKGFYFASELKALDEFFSKEDLSKTAINLFFSLTYIPAPFTIYKGVYKLESGKYMEISDTGTFITKTFFDLKSNIENHHTALITDYDLAKKQLRKLLFSSVEKRMLADVPLGSFLSGGIDSSIVSAIMAKLSDNPIKTFSIGFKEKAYDESDRAALVAKHIGSEHTLYYLDHIDLLGVVDETLAYFDEPFGDSSAIPSMMVARKAREKVTVALTGDCADELFGGYEKYLGKYYAEKYRKYQRWLRIIFERGVRATPHNNVTNHILRKVKKVINSASLSPKDRYLKLVSLGYSPSEKEMLLKDDYREDVSEKVLKYFDVLDFSDELTQTFFSDVKLILEGDMLTKIDRACMLNSLEARVPFLDSKIVDFSFRLPLEFKIKGKHKKRILKETFKDLLPEQTLYFGKKGFGIPIRLWFQNELKEELLGLLDDTFIEQQGIFEKAYIRTLIKEHMTNKENHSSKLWNLYVFQKWYLKQRVKA